MNGASSAGRRWLIALTMVLVVGTVVTVVIGLSRDTTVAGRPKGGEGGTESSPAGEPPHELEKVTEVEVFRFPKDEGRPADPDELAMEIHGDTGYVATFTGQALHLTAIRLTDGEIVWEQDPDLTAPPFRIALMASDDVLLVQLSAGAWIDNFVAYDLATGEQRWDVEAKLSHVVADRMITYDSDADVHNTHDLATGEQVWSVAADGGRASYFPQRTAESMALPRDLGDGHHGTFEVAQNTEEDQYVVQAAMHSGALAVLNLADGKVISQGNAGDRMTQVVAYEDTVYAYRQTPAELKAYAATDLSTPLWTVQTPPSQDGTVLDICGDRRLCLKTVTGLRNGPLLAFDTETGETVWQHEDYVASLPPTMAGDRMVLSHEGGTAILDPDTGEATETFDTEVYALPGDGVVVGVDGGELRLSQPDGTTVSLGRASGGLAKGTCEWTASVVLCADEETYQLWRYRG